MHPPPDDELPDPMDEAFPTDSLPDERARGFVPELVRKVAVAGLGALFMTEEGIRTLAGQMKLPKEVLAYILGQAEKTKDEISRVLSDEMRRFLQSEKLRDEFLKLLTGMTVEVKAQIRLVPRDRARTHAAPPAAAEGEPSLTPEVVVSEVSARRGRKKE